jgi:hypothetical protein
MIVSEVLLQSRDLDAAPKAIADRVLAIALNFENVPVFFDLFFRFVVSGGFGLCLLFHFRLGRLRLSIGGRGASRGIAFTTRAGRRFLVVFGRSERRFGMLGKRIPLDATGRKLRGGRILHGNERSVLALVRLILHRMRHVVPLVDHDLVLQCGRQRPPFAYLMIPNV